MQARTKIVATIGPSSAKEDILKKMIRSGVNVIRFNMSHADQETHDKWIDLTRKISKETGREVGILIDLQGPKIRIAKFKTGEIFLKKNDKFVLDSDYDKNNGNEKIVGIDYPLAVDLRKKHILLLDDGKLELEVEKVEANKIYTKVLIGGVLKNNKGINLQGGGLSANPLTIKDISDLEFAVNKNVDYIALSFVRNKQDIVDIKQKLLNYNSNANVIAKIERIEAIENLKEIIKASDAVMVARGDLGVEIGFAELPAVQKEIIELSNELNKVVITATQMMESMIANPVPTRAEVSDVATAIMQGTDAVMLSAETASGQYPVQVIEHMAKICLAVERQKETQVSKHRLDITFSKIDESIAMSAMYCANHLDVKAIVAFTETANTTLWMSRINTSIPIYGISRHKNARGRMTLYRSVVPIDFDRTKFKTWQDAIKDLLSELVDNRLLNIGDLVVVTRGELLGSSSGTNSLKIVTVGEYL